MTRARVVALAALVALFSAYAALKVYGLHHTVSDENIYFYMAVRTAFGRLSPYRDYFFAHPPLHLYLAVVWFKVAAVAYGLVHGSLGAGVEVMTSADGWADGGFALVVAKSITIVSGGVTAVFVYRVGRRAGQLEGVLAAGCFLLAPDILHSFFTGTVETVLFLTIGLERLLAGRDRQAGLALAAATLVALYAAPACAAMAALLLVVSPRRALTVAVWAAVPLVVVHGGFLLWAGHRYFDAVFAYHLHKPPGGAGFGRVFWTLLRSAPHLVMGAPLAVAALLLEGHRRLSRAQLREDARTQVVAYALAIVVATLGAVATGKAVFTFYLATVVGAAALLAGCGLAGLVRATLAFVVAARRRQGLRRPALAVAALLALAAAGEALASTPVARRSEIPDPAVGRTVPRPWRSSELLGPVDDAIRVLFGRDQQVLGERAPAITYYLWTVMNDHCEVATRLAPSLRDRLPPGERLFGESSLMPLVALASGRRLALEEADTNYMRFVSGTTDPRAFIARLSLRPPVVAIFGVDDMLPMTAPFTSWLMDAYEADLVPIGTQVYTVFTRKGLRAASPPAAVTSATQPASSPLP